MTREEQVKRFKNVKLVIGNGFDLHCNLKTSLKDYFNYNKKKNNKIYETINKNIYKIRNSNSLNISDYEQINIKQTNIWDFYFNNLYYHNNEYRWCDVEEGILNSFRDDEYPSFWKEVFRSYSNYKDAISRFYAIIAYQRNGNKKFKNRTDYYDFLLKELNEFEKDFGKYIKSQHSVNQDCKNNNIKESEFITLAIRTIEQLCSLDNLVSIDSFNYDSINDSRIKNKIYNLNGDCDNPIFGIDSNAFEADDYRYIFTKTNRRMELDMIKKEERVTVPFDNVVIYGHSLNKADYNYFFALFDKLNLIDSSNNSKVVFAYSLYPGSKPEDIRKNYRSGISQLFCSYSTYIGKTTEPNRLLDLLTLEDKVFIYEI